MIEPGWICYTVGVGEETSFDERLGERGCIVHAIDPTPRAALHVEKKRYGSWFHFHALGLWDRDERLRFYAPKNPEHVSHSIVNLQGTSDYFEAEVNTLSAIMAQEGHKQIDLLKLDIEGAEYRVLANIRQSGIRPKVLCVEFDQPATLRRMWLELRSLRQYGYQIVAHEVWNFTFVDSRISSAQ